MQLPCLRKAKASSSGRRPGPASRASVQAAAGPGSPGPPAASGRTKANLAPARFLPRGIWRLLDFSSWNLAILKNGVLRFLGVDHPHSRHLADSTFWPGSRLRRRRGRPGPPAITLHQGRNAGGSATLEAARSTSPAAERPPSSSGRRPGGGPAPGRGHVGSCTRKRNAGGADPSITLHGGFRGAGPAAVAPLHQGPDGGPGSRRPGSPGPPATPITAGREG